MRIQFALAAAGLLFAAAPALASGRTGPAPIPVLFPAASPQASGISIHRSGSIHSTNTVSTDTGGNSGSNVVTGEQSSTVTVANIAPSSDTDSVIVIDSSSPQPAPGPQCAGRLCPRTR